MTSKANIGAASTAPQTIDRIAVHQRAGVWRVMLNGHFFGDYARRYWAVEAAFEKADAIAARGGAAVITMAMDGRQDALLYDTRRPASRETSAPRTAWRAEPTHRQLLIGERFAQRILQERLGG